jgi:hypothetical protein
METGDMTTDRAPAARLPNGVLIVLVLVVLIGGALVWRHLDEQRKRDAALGAMVTAFQKQNSLTVFRAQVPVFVRNSQPQLFGLLSTEQIGVIPATIEYRLDLRQLDSGSFRWNPGQQTMEVTMPPLVVGEPMLDARRAQLVNRGVLVSGDAALNLMRMNMGTARDTALREARNPQMIALARAAAREMMTQNVTLPLRAAGYDKARVTVRFADEPGEDPSYIDQSRSYNEVLDEARAKNAAQGTR